MLFRSNRNKYQVQIYTAREQQAILAYQQTVAQAFREVGDALDHLMQLRLDRGPFDRETALAELDAWAAAKGIARA